MGRALLVLGTYVVTATLAVLTFTHHARPTDEYATLRLVIFLLFIPSLFKYLVQICVAPWYELTAWWRARCSRTPARRARTYQPRISVIVPAWNEEVGILTTVRSVLASRYPDVELIVVNDGSTDGTDRVMRAFLHEHQLSGHRIPIIYDVQPNGGKATAINHGIGLASGEIVMTVDADSVLRADALTNIVRRFEDERVMSVAGNVKIGNRSHTLGLVQQLEYLYGFYFKKADSLLNSIYIVGGAAAAYRRWVFDEVGGFDPSIITEDIEMSTRIQAAGYAIAYAADAVVYTEGAEDLRGLSRQRLRWKYGRLLTFARYRWLFFSLRRHHSAPLTLLILPVAVISEALLLLEWALLAIFFWYTAHTQDYAPILLYAGLTAVLVTLQVLTDPERRQNLNLLLLAPGAWCVLYLVDVVEFQALARSILRIIRGEGVTWQRWNRCGVFQSDAMAVASAPVTETTAHWAPPPR
ncbi:glycosyltransferase family 2 protein [Raineyella sp. LH-20]|uniref:glycosyltransferase family 2 protein n=1 Tax=Raineyella sp. LH-20 TaxID=3081204 RepID=UPI0029542B70|nr:glycosyltransferase family 2 protein [Raineyella sp. LH-20]WOP17716.1 glycosyltransferase family 2 protein [Raineyella sp. LH-20]